MVESNTAEIDWVPPFELNTVGDPKLILVPDTVPTIAVPYSELA